MYNGAKKEIETRVLIPKLPFMILGIFFIVTGMLLTVFFINSEKTIVQGLYIFVICVVFVGTLFLVIPYSWEIKVYSKRLVIRSFWRERVIDFDNIEKVNITLTDDIEVWNSKKKLIHIDSMCEGKQELLEFFKCNGITITEIV